MLKFDFFSKKSRELRAINAHRRRLPGDKIS